MNLDGTKATGRARNVTGRDTCYGLLAAAKSSGQGRITGIDRAAAIGKRFEIPDKKNRRPRGKLRDLFQKGKLEGTQSKETERLNGADPEARGQQNDPSAMCRRLE